jgi:lipopolysaccharide transport system permease protein
MRASSNQMDTTISHAPPTPEPVTTRNSEFSEMSAPAAPRSTRALPDKPVVIIQKNKTLSVFSIVNFWNYRELLYFLMWRDIKVRYKQTFLGVTWVIMQPLLMTLIFTVFLGVLARVPTGGLPYPLVVYTGLLPWTFFSAAVIGCCYSLIGNANLITKVYFPRILVPAAAVGARLVDFAISFVILIALMLFYRLVLHYPIALNRNLAMLPLLIVLITLLALGLGTLTAGLNVRYRDVGVALPVFVQLGMFVSPVLYPLNTVPANWQKLYFLNPMAGLVHGFRVALLGGQMSFFGLAVTVIYTIGLMVCAGFVFRRIEQSFADVI